MAVRKRGLGYLVLVVAVIVAPTAASLGWFVVTKDPNLRPLGLTQEALRARGQNGIEIVAVVEGADPVTEPQLRRSITSAFGAKGAAVHFEFRGGPPPARVTYHVGRSRIGPFAAGRAAEGISAAVAALQMHD